MLSARLSLADFHLCTGHCALHCTYGTGGRYVLSRKKSGFFGRNFLTLHGVRLHNTYMGEIFAQRFREYLTQLPRSREAQAAILGISVSSLQLYLAGKRAPDDKLLDNICSGLKLNMSERGELVRIRDAERATGVTKEYYTSRNAHLGKEGWDRVREGGMRVPVYNLETGDQLVQEDYLSVPGLTDPQAFGCFVPNDSMSPDFRKGDILVFSPELEVRDGSICFVRTHDLVTVRRIFFDGDDMRLVAANPHYPEQRIPRANAIQLWAFHGYYHPDKRR